MAGHGEAGGWRGQLDNDQATVSGPPKIDSKGVTRPPSDPSRDPSRDHEMRIVRDETRHAISHEPGEHEGVQVFMSRVPSTRNESTNEPQVERTRCDHALTHRA